MAIIIDADVIIRAEKGGFDLQSWLMAHSEDHFEMAAITVAELWHGVERAAGSRRLARKTFLQGVISSLPIIAYTEEITYEHARIWAQLEASGKMIGYYDVVVAATAMTRNSVVATFNTRHFSLISGLKIIEPK